MNVKEREELRSIKRSLIPQLMASRKAVRHIVAGKHREWGKLPNMSEAGIPKAERDRRRALEQLVVDDACLLDDVVNELDDAIDRISRALREADRGPSKRTSK